MGIRCADHVTPLYPQKLALTSPTGGGRSVGIVRSQTKATEFSLVYDCPFSYLLVSFPTFILYELKLLGLLGLGPILPVIKVHIMFFLIYIYIYIYIYCRVSMYSVFEDK